MCAISVVPAVIGIVATATTTAIQATMQSDAAQRQAGQQERQERMNAAVAKAQAADAIQAGSVQAGRIETEGRAAQASTMAALAAKGGAGEGSMGSLVALSGYNAAADADRVRAAAARQAWGFEVESEERLRRARQARRAGHLGSLAAGAGAASENIRGLASHDWAGIATDIYNS